jgi:hypothetical protein
LWTEDAIERESAALSKENVNASRVHEESAVVTSRVGVVMVKKKKKKMVMYD